MRWRWFISLIPIVLSLAALALVANEPITIGIATPIIMIGVALSLFIATLFILQARGQQSTNQHILRTQSDADVRVAQVQADADARVMQAQADARADADARVAQVQTDADTRVMQAQADAHADADARVAQVQADADALVAQSQEQIQSLEAQITAFETEKDRIRSEIEAHATKDLHGFYRRLNHEIGNTLQVLAAGVMNLRDSPDANMRQSIYEQVKEEILLLGALGNQLKRLTEIADKSTVIEQSSVDLGDLLEGIVDNIKRQPKNATRMIRLNIEAIPFKIPPVIGDRDLLLIAFRNLIDNAVKYTSPTGRIQARVFKAGEKVSVEIADDGRGIPAEDLPFIGTELRRGSNIEGVSGYGMGLAMVRAVVNKHQGHLDVQSWCEADRHGTMITVQLPVTVGLDQRAVG